MDVFPGRSGGDGGGGSGVGSGVVGSGSRSVDSFRNVAVVFFATLKALGDIVAVEVKVNAYKNN